MWKLYRPTVYKYPKIPLVEERRLIAKAKKGSKKSADELILRHIGFLIFRICKKAFPEFLKRFGDDLLSEAIFILYQKIESYDLDYCDPKGNPKPGKFASYVWKRIDGFILDSLKKEITRVQKERYNIRDAVSDISDAVEEMSVNYASPK